MSDIDWQNFFKPMIIDGCEDISVEQLQAICNDHNRRLWAVLQCQEKVYGDTKLGNYHGAPTAWRSNTLFLEPSHEARLVDVRKIEK